MEPGTRPEVQTPGLLGPRIVSSSYRLQGSMKPFWAPPGIDLPSVSGLFANQRLQSFQKRSVVLHPHRNGVRRCGGNLHALGKIS